MFESGETPPAHTLPFKQEDTWTFACDGRCGFTGSFNEVAQHEIYCEKMQSIIMESVKNPVAPTLPGTALPVQANGVP